MRIVTDIEIRYAIKVIGSTKILRTKIHLSWLKAKIVSIYKTDEKVHYLLKITLKVPKIIT